MSSPPASVHQSERSHSSKHKEASSRQHNQRRQHQEHPSTSVPHSRSPSSVALSPSSRTNTPTAIRVRTKIGQRRQHQEHPSTSVPHSRSPSSVALSPSSRTNTPTAIRVRTKIGQLGDPQPDPRAVSPAPGHTKRMIRSMNESTQRLDPHQNSFQPIRDRRLSPGSQYL
ncbi:hypothetical protein COOONC_04378 [Cooperia oncophora]